MRNLACLLALALLAGCSTTGSENTPSYAGAQTTTVEIACGGAFGVEEDAAHRSLRVSSGVVQTVTRSLARDCQDPQINKLRPSERAYEAAREYLRTTGRTGCRIVDNQTRALGRFEFQFSCDKADDAERKPARKKRRRA